MLHLLYVAKTADLQGGACELVDQLFWVNVGYFSNAVLIPLLIEDFITSFMTVQFTGTRSTERIHPKKPMACFN